MKLMPAVLEKPANAEDVRREVSKIRSIVTEAMEDGVRSARQAIKHGRYVAEDVIEDAQQTIKHRPLQAVGAVFAVGVMAGASLAWIGFRHR
jgi:ElaB/YqjD/DUF883 family membrane-anchored ribosome-binding protein